MMKAANIITDFSEKRSSASLWKKTSPSDRLEGLQNGDGTGMTFVPGLGTRKS
jgi:predicted glutamine amidotransferase